MTKGADRDRPRPIEIDGPPRAYFDIPLDMWEPSGGADEPTYQLEAADGFNRLVQRIQYESFACICAHEADGAALAKRMIDIVREAVHLRVMEGEGDGIIWWRRRPVVERYSDGKQSVGWQVHMRLATSPTLPPHFWRNLSSEYGNIHHEVRWGEPLPHENAVAVASEAGPACMDMQKGG